MNDDPRHDSTKAMDAFGETLGRVLREWLVDASAEDPGLMPALRRAQELDPDIGWLDVASFREEEREERRLAKKCAQSLTAYLGGLDS